MVHDFGVVSEQGGERAGVSSSDRGSLGADDLVRALGDVVGKLEYGARMRQLRFYSAGGPGPQDPVVDDFDGGGVRWSTMVDPLSLRPRHRTSRRCGADARGSIG